MARIPSKQEILEWVSENPSQSSKRDIAKAFGIKGADRIGLKAVLRELHADGALEKRKRTYRDPDGLPPVSVLIVSAADENGDLWAQPGEPPESGAQPRILLVLGSKDPALGAGDRILARLTKTGGGDVDYEARLIRKIGHQPRSILGIFRAGSEGGRIVPIDKKADREWIVPAGATNGARDGELIEAEQSGPKGRMGLPRARIINRLGDPAAPKAVSLIAIHQHGIPDTFEDEVLAEADAMTLPDAPQDLCGIAFLTIDPADARDHDDAVWSGADPDNPDQFILWVAIADVAQAVRPASALDNAARLRGNSTYFPDRVVPMLPERLSTDLCSLRDGVRRNVIAVRMVIDANGQQIAQEFHRGVINSRASLTYQTAQAIEDGEETDVAPEVAQTVRALFATYRAMSRARDQRGPLELDLPERRIVLNDEGQVTSVAFKERLDAHRLIEEFMVAANVAAANALAAKGAAFPYRVHEEPEREKLDALREVAQTAGLGLAKGQVLQPSHLNRLLAQARETDVSELISMSTLRAMQQAYYHPENFGHFGLALRAYAHFTSPIRRYADLLVHRALISVHGWGDDGLSAQDVETLPATCVQISQTERRSMLAERDTSDRYLAAFLSDRVGADAPGRISGVTNYGLFVRLDETGADGLVPVRSLGREYFRFDRDNATLTGEESGRVMGMGQRVKVRIVEATPITGGLILELLEADGKGFTRQAGGGRKMRGKSKPPKKARKVTRSRRR